MLVGRRGARARPQGQGEPEDRHADGQPGALARRVADDGRVHPAGGDRRGPRRARVDQPSARLLAAGAAAAACNAHEPAGAAAKLERPGRRAASRRRDVCGLSRPRHLEVGSVPRRRRRRHPVPPGLSPVQLARLGRVGPGGAGRHGRAPDRLPVLGARSRHADRGRNDLDAVQRRLLPQRDDDLLRVRGARQQAGGEDDVVRRRPAAAAAGGVHRRDDHQQPGARSTRSRSTRMAVSCSSAARAS